MLERIDYRCNAAGCGYASVQPYYHCRKCGQHVPWPEGSTEDSDSHPCVLVETRRLNARHALMGRTG